MTEIISTLANSLHGFHNIGHIEQLLNLHHVQGRDSGD